MAQQQQKKIEAPKEAAGSSLAKTMLVEGPQYLIKANALKVTSQAEHAQAIELLTQIAAKKKAAEEERLKITRPMDAAKTAVMTFFSALTDPFTSVDSIVRKKVKDWEAAEKLRIASAQKLLDDQAAGERKKLADQAAEEKRKADAKAEEQRILAKQQEDAAAKLLSQADDAEDPNRARELVKQATTMQADAAKLSRKADTIEQKAADKVEILESRAATVVAPMVQPAQLKTSGRIKRVVWKFEILDAAKLSRMVLTPDESKILALVKSLHHEAAAIIGEPGAVRIWDEDDIGIRSAK